MIDAAIDDTAANTKWVATLDKSFADPAPDMEALRVKPNELIVAQRRG